MGNVTLNGSTSGQITLAPTAVAGTNTLTLPAVTGVVLTSPMPATTLAATPSAGAVEYDGKVFYATPQGTQRGVIPGAQYYRLNADLAGTQATTAQNSFGVGVTLSGSTVYAFEINYMFAKTAGTTSHNFGFLFGGTATLNNINYSLIGGNSSTTTFASGGNVVPYVGYTSSASALTVGTGFTTATVYITLVFKGTVSVNAGGTFIPQYILSAAPGGAYSTVAGSYINIYPIGTSGTNTSVGAWA